MASERKIAVVIGAGPAGLTAAYEMLTRSEYRPIVLESHPDKVGGISRTVDYNGLRLDIGGHRYFSKSARVNEWWSKILPDAVRMDRAKGEAPPDAFLIRDRQTSIYYDGKFFNYPVDLSWRTIRNLGPWKMLKIAFSYMRRKFAPIKPEKNLEHFFINRFGSELYETFFRSYTTKVWGVPPSKIGAEWGTQRVKGLSISKALAHALRLDRFRGKVETSLIGSFLYPAGGSGHVWEKTAREVRMLGGEIRLGCRALSIETADGRVTAVVAKSADGRNARIPADAVFSTMPIAELVSALGEFAPQSVHDIARGLQYRDFISVGLLFDSKDVVRAEALKDNWIYVHEPGVRLGRMQIFNNWSPYMSRKKGKMWFGLEYFMSAIDPEWRIPDARMIKRAARELQEIGIVSRTATPSDGVVVRQEKAYPAYSGRYPELEVIRNFLDSVPNLFSIGRNGMHRYNNMDHSMLSAMTAVEALVGQRPKSDVWDVNAESDYHEERRSA